MKTTLAFASRTRRSTTAWIWLNSSSYITIWGLTITPPAARPVSWQKPWLFGLGIDPGNPGLVAPRLAELRSSIHRSSTAENHFYLTPFERTRATRCAEHRKGPRPRVLGHLAPLSALCSRPSWRYEAEPG